MAPLRCAVKFDPFLSLDCARVEGGEEGIKFCHLATSLLSKGERERVGVANLDRGHRRLVGGNMFFVRSDGRMERWSVIILDKKG